MNPRHQILSVDFFISRCEQRGIMTSESELEALHRKGWLCPIAYAGSNDGVPDLAKSNDLERLWRRRRPHIRYRPWSRLKDANGVFLRPPWYHSAQQYPLVSIKRAFTTGLNCEEFELLTSGNDVQISDVAKGICDEVVERVQRAVDRLPSWNRVTQILGEAELLMQEYRTEGAEYPGEHNKSEFSDLDDWYHYVAGVLYVLRESAKKYRARLKLGRPDLIQSKNLLETLCRSVVGHFDPELLLAGAPPSVSAKVKGTHLSRF